MAKNLFNKGLDKVYSSYNECQRIRCDKQGTAELFSKQCCKRITKLCRCFSGRPETKTLGIGEQKKNRVSAHGSKHRSGRKPRIHWWLFLDTDEESTLFFFDFFGSYGLLNFIVNNDLDVLNKAILGQFRQMFKQDNKITLLKWSFKLKNYEKLRQKDLNKLPSTAKYFFMFLDEFGKHKKVKNTVKTVTVDDNLRSFDTDYCRRFQMYFYLSLFQSLKGNVVARSESKKLNFKLIGELLNEIFNTNTRQNERTLDAFILQQKIEFDGEDVPFSDYEIGEV